MSGVKTRIRILLSSLLGKSFTAISTPNTPVISFDIFDTLIIRDVPFPTDVFEMLNPLDPTFKSRRIEAEKRTRSESGKEDITLEEIYKVLYDDPCERQHAMEREIEAELKVCKANKPALTFFNACKESGKKIIIISDMYLNSHTIRTILTKCGYDISSVPLYVSSEYAKTKHTGSLFKTVLSLENVAPHDIIHIGDNWRSDWLRPRMIGMKSVLVCHRA